MNTRVLLGHYRKAVEGAVEYLEAACDAAMDANDLKGYAKANKVVNDLKRTIEIADLVESDDSFRERDPSPPPRRVVAEQIDEDIIEEGARPPRQPRPEDLKIGPNGEPPRLGSGLKKMNVPRG